MYKKVNPDLNFVEREENTAKFWEENRIFEKSVEQNEGHPVYMFYDGPPTANGKPHIGHVETRVIKDMIPRYHTMKGEQVPRKAGWDTHGLPVELEVEKEIGIEGKDQIEEYGIEPFIKKCKESVWKYKGMWEKFSGKVGFWADMEHPYVTYYDDYIESEWWALKEIWKKGLLYKGFKVTEGPHGGCPFQGKGRGRVFPRMDDNPLDTAFQHCPLRKSRRDIREGKVYRRIYLLHGFGASGQGPRTSRGRQGEESGRKARL